MTPPAAETSLLARLQLNQFQSDPKDADMWFSPAWFAPLFDSRSRKSRLSGRERAGGRPRRRPTRGRLPVETLEVRCLLSLNPVAGPAVGAYPQAIAAGDLDRDGDIDLATANYGGTVSVLLGDGAGGFAAARDFSAGTAPRSLAVGDLNGDGNADLAVANGDSTVSVLIGDGAGGFAAPRTVALDAASPAGADSVAVGDINRDGKMELVATSRSEYTSYYQGYYGGYYPWTWHQGHVHVLIGDGTGGFTSQDTYDVGTGWRVGLAVADLDRDGDLDVAASNGDYGSVSVLMNAGDGSLESAGDYAAGWSPQAVAAGDFTGDGIPDLVTAGDSVDVLAGDGTGTFHGVSRQSVATAAVAAADFDGDGRLDAVMVDPWSDAVTVLLGRGDGTLSPPVSRAAGLDPVAVAVGDFNGDGREDAAAANAGSNSVSVLLNDGTWPAANAPLVSIDDAAVVEGNAGTKAMTFTVRLSAAPAAAVWVDYATADGAASAGLDYKAAAGRLVFAPGQTTATITVTVYGDRVVESGEWLSVWLTGASTFVADGYAFGNITDDEPRISLTGGTVTEGNSGVKYLTFTVTLSAAYDQAVTVNFATQNGTAAAGSDYQAASGKLTFAAGETTKTVRIAVIGDKSDESDESFGLRLSGASGNALITSDLAYGWILDDDRKKGNARK